MRGTCTISNRKDQYIDGFLSLLQKVTPIGLGNSTDDPVGKYSLFNIMSICALIDLICHHQFLYYMS